MERPGKVSDFHLPARALGNDLLDSGTSKPDIEPYHQERAQISSPSNADAVLNFDKNFQRSKVGGPEIGEDEKKIAKKEPGGRLLSSVANSQISDFSRKTSSLGLASDSFEDGTPSFSISEHSELNQLVENPEFQEKSPVGKSKGTAANNKGKSHQYDTSGKSFARRDQLRDHRAMHRDEIPYQCDLCSREFRTQTNLVRHLRMHRKGKPHKCEVCEACFACSTDLTLHKRIHTGEKPFECDTCKRKFRRLSDLTRHKLVHTGEKPFECDTCEKKFRTLGGLTIHKIVHTGEKPYECDTCKRKFGRLSDLTRHKVVHTGEKPFECDTCKRKFGRLSDLTRHKKIHARKAIPVGHLQEEAPDIGYAQSTAEDTL